MKSSATAIRQQWYFLCVCISVSVVAAVLCKSLSWTHLQVSVELCIGMFAINWGGYDKHPGEAELSFYFFSGYGGLMWWHTKIAHSFALLLDLLDRQDVKYARFCVIGCWLAKRSRSTILRNWLDLRFSHGARMCRSELFLLHQLESWDLRGECMNSSASLGLVALYSFAFVICMYSSNSAPRYGFSFRRYGHRG